MSKRKQYKPKFKVKLTLKGKVKSLHAKIGELTIANGARNIHDASGITVFSQLVRKAQTMDR